MLKEEEEEEEKKKKFIVKQKHRHIFLFFSLAFFFSKPGCRQRVLSYKKRDSILKRPDPSSTWKGLHHQPAVCLS